eukprot:gene10893-9914_t
MATRALSTSRAVADDLVRPPIQKFGVEGRYAHALYSAAAKTDALAKVEKEINTLTKLIATDGGLDTFLKDPVMSRGEKTAAIEETLTKQKYSPTVVNFFGALAENNRLPEYEEILSCFGELMSAHRNEVNCTITSAKALDTKTLNAVKKSLSGFAGEGATISVSTAVDESILGGLVVAIGDKYIDMSTASRIQKIKAAMSSA